MQKIKYSIVIPTYNRATSLSRALHSVINQTVRPHEYEIIVVDDGSGDNTRQTVKEIIRGHQRHEIRYIFQENQNQAAAKNTGIKNARGEIVFFTDDDCVAPKNWIEKLAEGYKKYPEIAGAGGWCEPPAGEKRFFQKNARQIRSENLKKYGYLEKEKLVEGPFHPTCWVPNVSYKKSVLKEVGGFDEKIPAFASDELKFRITAVCKKPILSVPVAITHYCPLNFSGYLKKLLRRGASMRYFRDKYRTNNPSVFSTKPTLNYLPARTLPRPGIPVTRRESRTNKFIYLIIVFSASWLGEFLQKLPRNKVWINLLQIKHIIIE